jgi:uncharacterized protein (DUF4415 family)
MNDTVTDRPPRRKPPLDFDEAPELTEEMLARARPASEVHGPERAEKMKRGRPPKAAHERKQQITLRLSPDVIAALRASGEGWQTRVDEALRCMFVAEPIEWGSGPVVWNPGGTMDLVATIDARVRAAGATPPRQGATLFAQMLSRDAGTGEFAAKAAKPSRRGKKKRA